MCYQYYFCHNKFSRVKLIGNTWFFIKKIIAMDSIKHNSPIFYNLPQFHVLKYKFYFLLSFHFKQCTYTNALNPWTSFLLNTHVSQLTALNPRTSFLLNTHVSQLSSNSMGYLFINFSLPLQQQTPVAARI